MYYFIMVLIVIVSLLLVGVVMIQNSKGGGLASDFSSSNQIVGVKRTGDFLEKATWGLAIMLICFSLVSNFFIDREVVEQGSAIQELVDEAPMAEPASNFPSGGDAPVQ
jgi:preprotein translocase subunit SecG